MTYHQARLEEALAWARTATDPRARIRLDMGVWYVGPEMVSRGECGTFMCIGGYVIHRAGGMFLPNSTPPHQVLYCTLGGRQRQVSDAARCLLGIEEHEAYVLFDMDMEYEDVLSLDFLGHLCARARMGRRNLTESQTEKWVTSWLASH